MINGHTDQSSVWPLINRPVFKSAEI